MRKTELWIGVYAGAMSLIVAALSMARWLPYAVEMSSEKLELYALICMAAGVAGIIGAVLVPKRNIIGSVIMAICVIALLLFGFPWQSASAVLFIISAAFALAPVGESAH